MLGKQKCRILREIRRKIATEYDIPLVTEECRYQGDCRGTCPKCESELRYLEEQLEKRRAIGKKVTVSAMAVGLLATAGGCRQQIVETEGLIPNTETTEEYVLEGEVAVTEPETEEFELEGDVAYFPEDETSEPETAADETQAP